MSSRAHNFYCRSVVLGSAPPLDPDDDESDDESDDDDESDESESDESESNKSESFSSSLLPVFASASSASPLNPNSKSDESELDELLPSTLFSVFLNTNTRITTIPTTIKTVTNTNFSLCSLTNSHLDGLDIAGWLLVLLFVNLRRLFGVLKSVSFPLAGVTGVTGVTS